MEMVPGLGCMGDETRPLITAINSLPLRFSSVSGVCPSTSLQQQTHHLTLLTPTVASRISYLESLQRAQEKENKVEDEAVKLRILTRSDVQTAVEGAETTPCKFKDVRSATGEKASACAAGNRLQKRLATTASTAITTDDSMTRTTTAVATPPFPACKIEEDTFNIAETDNAARSTSSIVEITLTNLE
ncbi:hypothetical protein Trydic_g17122 [Trypoxylus dichotomus]